MKELENHGINGISTSHGEIIGFLLKMGPLQMGRIAEITGKDKSTVTALINKLILQGYVKKYPDKEDNRIAIIKLTRKGMSLSKSYDDISNKLRETSYKGLSDNEKDDLAAILSKIEKNL